MEKGKLDHFSRSNYKAKENTGHGNRLLHYSENSTIQAVVNTQNNKLGFFNKYARGKIKIKRQLNLKGQIDISMNCM